MPFERPEILVKEYEALFTKMLEENGMSQDELPKVLRNTAGELNLVQYRKITGMALDSESVKKFGSENGKEVRVDFLDWVQTKIQRVFEQSQAPDKGMSR